MKLPEQTAVTLFNWNFACWTAGKSGNAGSELNTAVLSDVRVFRGLWFYNRWHQTLFFSALIIQSHKMNCLLVSCKLGLLFGNYLLPYSEEGDTKHRRNVAIC